MPSRRGWRWDGANSRLDVDVDGTTVARFDDGTGDIEIVSGTINVADGGTVGQDTSKSTAVSSTLTAARSLWMTLRSQTTP